MSLSGKSGAAEAMQALLGVLQRGFDIFDACFLQATGDGVRISASARADHADLMLPLPAGFLDRARRLTSLVPLAGGRELPGQIGRYASVLIAPLLIPGEGSGALMLGCEREGRFSPADLRLLERVATLAAQRLIALREARRNALLVSLIEGRAVEPGATGVLDAPLEAVYRAFARLTDMQGEVVGILDDLLGAPLAGADAAIDEALGRMGAVTRTDRVYVFRLRPEGDFIDNTHEWCAPGIESVREMLQEIPASMIEHWRKEFDAGREVLIPDVAAMSDDAPEKHILVEQGIRSLLTVPMIQDGTFRGFVGYDAVREHRNFLPGEVHLVRSVAKVIASVLARRDAEALLVEAYAEAAAQRTRLSSVLAAMPDLVVELDRKGRFVTWHSGVILVPDAVGAAFAGRQMEEVLPAELAAEGRKVLAEIDAGEVPGTRSFPFALVGEREHWWQLSAAAMGTEGYLFVLRDITEARKQTVEIERLSEIARRTTNLVVVTDTERRIEWVNAAFERTTGWRLDEVKGRSAGSFLQTAETDPETVAQLRSALDRGEAAQAEILNRSRDGRAYWIALDIQPLRDVAGNLRGFMAVETDVTEQRMHAEALQKAARGAAQARDTLEAALGVLQDGFVLFDADDRLVICNDRYREIYARSAPAIVPGASFESILRYGLAQGQYAEAAGREEEWLAARLARHRQPYSEIERQLTDGRWLRIFEKATPDGGRVGVRVDITALKRAEQRALADRSAAMEASHDGIAITDADGRFLYMNRAHLGMFGFSDEAEAIGKPWSMLYAPDEAAWMVANAMPRLFAEGSWAGEIMGRRLDGQPVDQDVSLTLKEDGGILCITRDVSVRRREASERERLREELHLAQRREVVGQMAVGLAHDFNNLLATISGSASLIETAAESGSIIAAGARRIEVATKQAAGLVKRLLTLGARPSDRRRLDLRQLVREATDLARASLKAPHRLSLSLPAAAVEVVADPTDILQIVLNLVINARDAMQGQPGKISVTLSEASPASLTGTFAVGSPDPSRRYACLTVTDTGPGMPADLAQRAFQPYVSTKGDKGTGLGLAIVASVVKANAAAIRLETAPGAGTRFDILWPVGSETTVAARAAVEGLTGQLEGRLILVVDDQKDVLDVLTAMLEAAGAEVAPTTVPADVIAAVESDPAAWDLVITDYDMPGMTGAELAETIGKLAPTMPVILVTALAGIAGRSGARFDAVLAKPIDRATLVKTAETAILRAQPKG
ncbi:PAS-domain containing protein [Ciceribacter sp. RN22]|uniref:PAS-domain containing protein n=1 Tax=Ciceribacter sp. RN22 TaxID=2954932 RepID=UPI002092EFC1|nr:PAS-domain containing protein [Ciceribacter sp. RN22]MCO6177018.1 PAS-domain containing protein [Ciceribacter sp. RN22]